MATRRRTKKQTLAEFRAWLSGVEELQPEDWAPTADQWKLIREKINGITGAKTVVDVDTLQKLLESSNRPTMPYTMTNAQVQAAHILPSPPPAGGVPTGPVTQPTPAAVAVMPAQAPVDLGVPATPNLDTSDGNYESGFS